MNEKKYKTPEAFRTAIEARAKKLRDETGAGLDMQRRKVAFDAFLCRVAVSGTPLVLKGGYQVFIRRIMSGPTYRPSRDMRFISARM